MENMNRTLQWTGAVLAGVVAGFLFSNTALALSEHRFSERDCGACHGEKGTGLTWQKTRPETDVSPKCVNCHSSCDTWGGHREAFTGQSAMATSLPPWEGERIVCVTCHDPHSGLGTAPRDTDAGTLRMSNLKRELCLNCHRSEGLPGGAVEVAMPLPGVITYEDYVPLLGRTRNLGEDHLEVTINGASFPLPVEEGLFHTRLRMLEGLNRIVITSKGETLWASEVYRASYGEPATNYGSVYYGHQTSSLAECLECHSGREGGFQVSAGPTPDLCYQCHDPLDRKRFLHGPLAVGDCLSCHDPHGGVGPFHLRDQEVALCLSCHDAEMVQDHRGWKETVAEGGSCSACHDPHQSDTRFLVRQVRLQAD